jgi:4-amino-4-deoxy-L-arabinose transferase-like glycosyltransferase
VGVRSRSWSLYLALLLIAASVYLIGIISPPSLTDDVDSVQAQIARNMITTGDYVTARLDGIAYLEKPPLIYWMMAGSYKVFGVHDWAARMPIALFCVGLVLLTAAFGEWAFDKRIGFYAGLVMATCIGLYLFTRVLIPDVILTFTITLSMWALLRVMDDTEPHPRAWAFVLAASFGVGLLLKSLIAVVFPVGAGLIYLAFTRQLFSRWTWKRLHLFSGLVVMLAIAVPWHVLATLRNPPYWSWAMHSGPGEYHGFLWFFFINEQLLRFLNLRYPRDYNTVPALYFWLFHLIWLFPWSVYFPAVAKLSFRPVDRAGRARLLALCWIGVVLVFFTFSTTQEYYSMPCYPAMALLLGSAMAADSVWIKRGTRVLTAIAAIGAVVGIAIYIHVRNLPTPGDIFNALTQHPSAYTLSLGHMEDLTLESLAYLRAPLIVAIIALAIGAIVTFRAGAKRAFVGAALMMLVFFQASRMALVTFDPYMSSRPLAEALLKSPEGKLIVDKHYYAYSSVFFYTNKTALLLNGRILNLSYGSYAPGAPNVFIDDSQLKELWTGSARYYLVAGHAALPRLENDVGREKLNVVAESGGKYLLTNIVLPGSTLLPLDVRASNFTRDNVASRTTVQIQTPRWGSKTDSVTFGQPGLDFTNPASMAQTRYDLTSSAKFASYRTSLLAPMKSAGADGFPSDRIARGPRSAHLLRWTGWQAAPAVRDPRSGGSHRAPLWRGVGWDGSSVPEASLHCTSPEEDA